MQDLRKGAGRWMLETASVPLARLHPGCKGSRAKPSGSLGHRPGDACRPREIRRPVFGEPEHCVLVTPRRQVGAAQDLGELLRLPQRLAADRGVRQAGRIGIGSGDGNEVGEVSHA